MGAAAVLVSHSLVRLAVGVEILNALLLPIVLGFLLVLAWKTLPRPQRVRRGERVAITAVIAAVVAVGLAWAGLSVLPGNRSGGAASAANASPHPRDPIQKETP